MERIGLLMLGGAKRVSVGRMFLEAGRKLGYDVELYSYELDYKVPVAQIAEIIVGRRWNDADIIDHLAQTVEINRINIVVPFVDGAIGVAARLRQKCPGLFVASGDENIVDMVFDKIKADGYFRRLNVPVPALGDLTTGPFPIIAKPSCGSASKGLVILRNMEDARSLNKDLAYIFQEYIEDSEEFSVDCYITAQGRVVAAVPRKRLETSSGEVTRTVTVEDHEVIRVSDMVLSVLGLTGPVTLQFIRDLQSGRLMLMEVNPRMGGGVVCSVHSGANIPEMIIKEWAGIELIPARWTPGVEIARYFDEVVFNS